jgi:carbamoyltransferase
VSVVLGVHDGHNASAALLRDGRIELALQEERLTRVKNQGDAPGGAVRAALALVNGGPTPVAALNGLYMNYRQWQRETILRDYARCSSLGSRLKQTLKTSAVDRMYQRRRAAQRAEHLGAIGLSSGQLAPVEHHQAHAAAAYYASPWARSAERILVLTCDGSGDRLSATVSVGQNARLMRLAEVSEHDSIGRLYALVTRWLGMVPLEHEYKVMGLAPYAAHSRGAADVARALEGLFEPTGDGLGWRRRKGVPSMYTAYAFLGTLLEGQRFDWVAAGVQRFIESMLTRWVAGAVRETGIGRIACAGGVFMNVKANLAILELPEVESMFVFPSCGDESNSIGAACWEAARCGQAIEPLGAIYYGELITDRAAEKALENAARDNAARAARLRFDWIPDIEKRVASELAQGRIVARAKGAAEFGARALGNRSILARADSPAVVRTINEAIKNRDFWMPFAPAMPAERAARYYEKPKPVESPYMMFAFRTRPERRAALAGAQHPYDFTTRPQEVRAEHNPEFHRLLQEYESITGEAAVLNTSFNLHGEPIVYHARDAVDVFLRSGLEHMALANWWVEKAA